MRYHSLDDVAKITLLNPYMQKYKNVNILHENIVFLSVLFFCFNCMCIFLLLKLFSTAVQSMYHIFDVTGLYAGEQEGTL